MDIHMSNLFLRREAESRSVSAENPTGGKGLGAMATAENSLHPPSARAARGLDRGWKVSPCVPVPAGETITLMDVEGPGILRHIWLTLHRSFYRDLVIRIHWDGHDLPAVECPVGDLFCCPWSTALSIPALPINVNPMGGMNLYFPMPFRKSARITATNEGPKDLPSLYYAIDYTLEGVPEDALLFHAQWRRNNPLPRKTEFVLLDGVHGTGHFVGTAMAWQANSPGWWGEGEIKMYIDGDDEFPTICGTGTEDYFGGAWCFGKRDYGAPFMGYQCVSGEPEVPGARYALYRFHVLDPVHFRKDLKVTIQALGWESEDRYRLLEDDLASTVFWYQTAPAAPFPPLPSREARAVD
ncbi:MAG: glycoside hydrolase family 172 protein [Planctomycetota bacterium]|jgi:hypothetical protein